MKKIIRRSLSPALFCLLSAFITISCKEDDNITTPEPESPVITSFFPNPLRIARGDTVVLQGRSFGRNRGQSRVCFKFTGGDSAMREKVSDEYFTWADSLIRFIVPDSVSRGVLYINRLEENGSASSSNSISYTERTEYSFISGDVKLSDGTPVEGVTIRAGNNSVYTDIDGKYFLDSLAVGTEVDVQPEKPFYSFSQAQKVKVMREGVDNINFSTGRTDEMVIKTIREGNITIYTINKGSTIIIKIPNISDYLYNTSLMARYLIKIADSLNYRVLVNASYFDYSESTKLYSHAGYLKLKNEVLAPAKPKDLQIMQLFAYNTAENRVQFFELSELEKTSGYDLVFQTGPRIVRNNKVANSSIDSSYNGNTPHWRTSFATVDGNEFYIIVNKPPTAEGLVVLKDLGQMLLDSGIFYKGQLNVIGFDGGVSTGLYIRNHPELTCKPVNAFPTLIGVR